MPLTMPFPDPTSEAELDHTYIWAAETNFNFATKHGRIVFLVHRDEAAAYANKSPLATIAFDISPAGTPAVLDSEGNVVSPAFPSFDELIGYNAQAYNALATAVYQLAMSRPEFTRAQVIVRPMVEGFTPENTIKAGDPIAITFNQSVLTQSIQLSVVDDQGTGVSATVVSNVDGVVTVSASMVAGRTYTVRLLSAKSATGNSLAQQYEWTLAAS